MQDSGQTAIVFPRGGDLRGGCFSRCQAGFSVVLVGPPGKSADVRKGDSPPRGQSPAPASASVPSTEHEQLLAIGKLN